MPQGTYVLAVKRELRGAVPPDWVDRVRRTRGVTVTGAGSTVRLQVRAEDEAIRTVERELGEFLHIEPLIRHERL